MRSLVWIVTSLTFATYMGWARAQLCSSITSYPAHLLHFDGQWVEVDLLETGVSGRYVRVLTTYTPSWVAWSEIEVYE